MSDDVTEITCDGCTAASDWYCVKCWNGLVRELHDAEVQRDAARERDRLGKMVASRIQAERDAARQRVAELEQLLALRAKS
jgi:hypothetical protein